MTATMTETRTPAPHADALRRWRHHRVRIENALSKLSEEFQSLAETEPEPFVEDYDECAAAVSLALDRTLGELEEVNRTIARLSIHWEHRDRNW